MIIKHAPKDWGIPLSNPSIQNYLRTWVFLTLFALVIAVVNRQSIKKQYAGYFGYLILRDGTYTQRWVGNLILSGIIFACAGFFWNLELNENNQISLGFSRDSWPNAPTNKRVGKLFWIGIPIGLIALYFIVGFVGWGSKVESIYPAIYR